MAIWNRWREFIRLYLTRAERWESPKFLAGESYGTTRAAALSQYLLDNDGIYLNGITLISSVLNFETISFARGNDLPYALFLPSYTAAAWYHKKLPKDLQGDLEKAIGESRRFAGNEYSVALMKGDKLTTAERASVVHELARLTGLPEQYVEESNLRISEAALHQGTAARPTQDRGPLRQPAGGRGHRCGGRDAGLRSQLCLGARRIHRHVQRLCAHRFEV